MAEGRVEDLYQTIKTMAVTFALKPGDRINEVALARDLGASRTPLREALNRLVAEKLVDFRPGTGFFCRGLDPKSVFDLYELRQILEVAAVRAAAERASDDDLAALKARHYRVEAEPGQTVGEASAADEAFHMDIAELTGNAVLSGQLSRINDRIRFIRWIDMGHRIRTTKGEHRRIIDALVARNSDAAAEAMSGHIARRMDQVTLTVREGLSSIYLDGPEALYQRKVEDLGE